MDSEAVETEAVVLDRDYGRSPHPPTCTCVECTQRRNARAGRRSLGDRLTESGGNWQVLIAGAAIVIAIVLALLFFL